MTKRFELASLVLIVALLVACARSSPPVPTPKATRTPKPTFTRIAESQTSVASESPTSSVGVSAVPSTTRQVEATPAAAGTPSAQATAATTATSSGTVAPTATRTATATATRTNTPVPTATPVPTNTPLPSPTPLACPGGYDMYTHPSLGFKACHPAGWTVSEEDDPEESARWVTFNAPTSNRDTGEGLKLIAVRVSPNTFGKTGDEFLAAGAVSLIDEFSDWLVEWPYAVRVGNRDAVEANYQMGLLFQAGRVMVVGWKAYLLAGDQQWLIQAVGRSEYRNELQGIHDEFLDHFFPSP